MEGEKTRQDCDEFEMILREIPHATSEVRHAGGTDTDGRSPEHSRMSSPFTKFRDLYNSPRAAGEGGNMAFYDGSTLSNSLSDRKFENNRKLDDANSGYGTPALSARRDGSNLSGGESLGLAFQELSLKEGLDARQPMISALHSNNISPNHTIRSAQYVNPPSNSISELGSVQISDPSVTSTVNGIDIFSPGLEADSSFMSTDGVSKLNGKIDGQELRYQIPGSLLDNFMGPQRFPVHSAAIPVSAPTHAYQLFSTVHGHGIELTASPYQQQYYLDTQTPVYISPRHLGQSDMEFPYMEGRYSAIDQEYFHAQQMQNLGSVVHKIPMRGTTAIRPSAGNIMQPCFELPLSHRIDQGSENSYWNSNYVQREFNRLNLSATGTGLGQYHPWRSCGKGENCRFPPQRRLTTEDGLTCSAKHFLGHQVINKGGKQNIPENMLTKSHGVNSLRSLRHNSVVTDQSRFLSDRNGWMISRDHTQDSSPAVSHSHYTKSVEVKDTSLDEVVGRILSMAKDQHGCRFLQKKFAEGPEDVGRIFVEIIDHIAEIMIDPFGNYLVQKLLEVCNDDQKMGILKAITRKTGELIRISCDMHGTRAIQKLIEILRTKEQFSMLVSSLKPGVVPLMKDINGNHVALRCLQYLSPEYNEFLFDAAVAHCVELATDRQGCCVLQSCLCLSDGTQKHKLMSEISSNSLLLSQDPYGNYVVQYLLDQKVTWVVAAVLDCLEGNYKDLSMQKYSSNVVEKCLKLAGEDERVKIIQELMHSSCILKLSQDPYGNYVIQSALNESKGAIYAALVEAIRPHVPVLLSCLYGKKILSCMSRKK